MCNAARLAWGVHEPGFAAGQKERAAMRPVLFLSDYT